jgi:ABC-type polysaccharide/polyol phosphate export permease
MTAAAPSFVRDLGTALCQWRVWGYLALNDLKVRYARSRIGFAWILLSFAIWAAGIGFMYARLFEFEVREFVPFLAIGFALWAFITGTIVDCGSALVNAAGYVKQFNRPKQVYVWRACATQAVTLAAGLLVCGAILAIVGRLSVGAIVFALPGLVLLLAAGAVHAFLFAYLVPFARDLPHVAASALNLIFFVTPIIFPPALLARRGLADVYRYNPFHYLIDVVRAPLLTGDWPAATTYMVVIGYVVVLGALTFGLVCRRLDRRLVYAL